MGENAKRSVEVMGYFLSEVSLENSCRIDYLHLSALYNAKSKQVEAFDNGILRGQMELLKKHVKACHDIWKLVRTEMVPTEHTLDELYRMKMDEQALPPGRRSSASHSPVKRGVARPENMVKKANRRALATLWHEALDLDDMSLLCADVNELKRLIISFSATIASHKPAQLFP